MKSFARFVSGLFLLGLLIGSALAAPILDTAFGTQGVTRIGGPAGLDELMTASAIQPDGKVIAAGIAVGINNYRQSNGFITRFTTAGTLDPDFGNAGVVLLSPPQPSYLVSPSTIDFLPDGKLMVASVLSEGGFMLTRLNSHGPIDPTFGSGGSVVVVEPGLNQGTTSPLRIAIQSGGKILVVTGAPSTSVFSLRFRRFLPSGALDATFGTDGVRVLDNLPANFQFRSSLLAAVEPGGGFTIVANGMFSGIALDPTYLVLRVTADGALDRAFGGTGYVSGYDIGNPFDVPTALARGADGRYVLFGYAVFHGGLPITQDVLWKIEPSGTRSTFGPGNRVITGSTNFGSGGLTALPDGAVALAHGGLSTGSMVRFAVFEANGNPRAGFGNGGSVTMPLTGYAAADRLGLFADAAGRLTAAGSAYLQLIFAGGLIGRGADALLASVSASGVPRTDFGRGDGTATWNEPSYSYDSIDALLVDSSGRIEVAGSTSTKTTSSGYMVSRLGPDGTPDSTFGSGGRATPDGRFLGFARASLQPSGATIVASGSRQESSSAFPTVFRINADGSRDTTFAPAAAAAGSGAVGLAVRPDGRIVYLAWNGAVGVVLQQFRPDGSTDPSFGTNGRVKLPGPDAMHTLADLVLLDDGSIVFATFSGTQVQVSKVDAAGALVTSFGAAGSVTSDAVDITYQDSTNDQILALADGTFMTVGAAWVLPLTSPFQRFTQIVRYSANGVVISTQRLPLASNSYAMAALALPDASVIIARVVAPSVATLARLLPDDQFDQAYGGVTGYPVTLTAISALALDAMGGLIVGGQDATSALVARYRLDSVVSSVFAVEFFNVDLRHYFITSNAAEQKSIDSGGAGPGWQRTGNNFRLWVPEVGVPVGAVPVCRFYGTPGRGPNSHFYTASGAECAAVKRDAGWTYEGIAFYVLPPQNDQCVGSQPVYRAYNNGFVRNDSNHRYSTQLGVLQAMTAQGWSVEGVAFCGAQ